MCDEGYNDEDALIPMAATTSPVPVIHATTTRNSNFFAKVNMRSEQECEELAYQLLASLPRSRLATIQRRLAPLLQFDVVGSLPAEVSLHIFSLLPATALLTCALVCRRWQTLANDQSLWKQLCIDNAWEWRAPHRVPTFDDPLPSTSKWHQVDSDDEGMGDSDEEADEDAVMVSLEDDELEPDHDSGFVSFTDGPVAGPSRVNASVHPRSRSHSAMRAPPTRHSAPSILNSFTSASFSRCDYKLLHQTHVRLHNRFLSSSYRLSALQTRGAPTNAHTNTIYCLQLYTYPLTGKQVLLTGSRDKTVREWNVATGLVERVISGVHASSVLSLCVYNGMLATAGSDRKVALWDLEQNVALNVISDHEDSVLCVRFDDERLVSCSKDRTVRTYRFPDMTPEFVLNAHRAAVNAVSISPTLIVSGSGDRSIKLWSPKNGELLRSFDNHHTRGIASIDFCAPQILSGSSDKHLRLFDITTLQGWSTAPKESQWESNATNGASLNGTPAGQIVSQCQVCGNTNVHTASHDGNGGPHCVHGDLVRSVALGDNFVVSGSYDLSIKVWDRKTGALVANLSGGHTGRIFCVGFDCTKIVSCGEDQRIRIWDFSHGIDISFIRL